MQTKKNVFLWVLYDFANSFVSIVFFLYFAQWIVVDRGFSDLTYNLTFTVSAIALLFTVPTTGVLLDKYIQRIKGLRYSTVFTAIFYSACAVSAIFNKEIPALIFFTLGMYSYLLSFTFYTPLINDISHHTKRGLVSGLGIGANYLGQIAGLLVALPFSTGSFSLFNALPRAETLLPSVIFFFVLSLPMLIFFKEDDKKRNLKINFKASIKETLRETKLIFALPSLVFFLVSYFLFNDAVLTAANNFPIFLEQVWHISDTVKTFVMLGILVTSAIGGLLAGIVADKYGHKRTLSIILLGWVVILPLVAFIPNFTLFVIITSLMGIWYGANWAVSRSVMSYVAPKGKHNLAFAYFGLAERASSFIGPIVWGLVVGNLVWMGGDRYRFATLVVTAFVIFGVLALLKVKDDRAKI